MRGAYLGLACSVLGKDAGALGDGRDVRLVLGAQLHNGHRTIAAGSGSILKVELQPVGLQAACFGCLWQMAF